MPFTSRAYRVLIASPADVDEEREIAVRVIQEWNDLHSYTKGVVLLPLRWETHSAPEYGTRPQEVINRAIVDQCDLLVGIFWTRIGTPTGVTDSGTLEEIGRVAQAGKPIMLYFSNVGMDPGRIDLEQLGRLNAFKSATYPNALTESYKSHVEFRDKFARQLELRVRELQKSDSSGGPPPLVLSVAAKDLKSMDGQSASRCVEAIDVVDLDHGITGDQKRVAQLRRMIQAYVERAATTPIVLGISNTGSSGIRNLYVELDITASTEMTVTDTEPRQWSRLWMEPLTFHWNFDHLLDPAWTGPDLAWEPGLDLSEGFSKTDTGWRLTFEWAALQPNRKRLVSPALFVRTAANGTMKLLAKVFADSLPEPVVLEAHVQMTVRHRKMHVADLVGHLESAVNKSDATIIELKG